MRRLAVIFLVVAIACSFLGCSRPTAPEAVTPAAAASKASAAEPASASTVEPTAEPAPAPTPTPAPTQSFPYEKDGMTWHQLMINGEVVETEHLPFSLSGEEGAYLPLEDVLAYFGVPCIVDKDMRMAAGRVNGTKFEVQAKYSKMTVGKKTIESTVCPLYVNGCLYVPNFLFMELLGATVDFTADRSTATVDTDMVIDKAKSGTDGIKLSGNTFGDGSVKLTLTTDNQSACAKLFFADATAKGDEVLVAFINPNESVLLRFSAGTYILKLAYGDVWLGDDQAFGDSGVYSSTEAYTFKKGGQYKIATSKENGDFYTDSKSGFLGQ